MHIPKDDLPKPPRFRPKQVYEQVSQQIQAEILSGRFPPGSRLPSERELAAQFGVGRPAVREAIGALQNRGLVLTRKNSGSFVSQEARHMLAVEPPESSLPGEHEADCSPLSTLDVRLMLEPAIARRAASRSSRDREAEILAEQLLDRMEEVHDIDDPAQQALWTQCDRLFHRQLAVLSGDGLLVKIADDIADTMNQALWQRLRDDGIYTTPRIRLYVAEHRLIYEAIRDGDGDAAAFYVEQHLKRVKKDIAPN